MKHDTNKPTHDELIKMLSTTGWHLKHREGGSEKHTLEEMVRASHARHKRGEDPGLISQFETSLELDLVELQDL